MARGFRVIRFDNRDIGLSQSFDHVGVPNLALDSLRFALGLRVKSPYTLADMAADSVGVLDALGIAQAHVCGASMGGMIAQHMAARYPERVKSLTLMMTTSGARRLPGPIAEGARRDDLAADDPQTSTASSSTTSSSTRLIGSPAYPRRPTATCASASRRSVRRSYRPAGTARQMVAIAADGDRSPLLGTIRLPTHDHPRRGRSAGAGRRRARPGGARSRAPTLDVIDGMGHDLPVALWPRFVAGIARPPAAPEREVGCRPARAGAFAAAGRPATLGVAPCQDTNDAESP